MERPQKTRSRGRSTPVSPLISLACRARRIRPFALYLFFPLVLVKPLVFHPFFTLMLIALNMDTSFPVLLLHFLRHMRQLANARMLLTVLPQIVISS